jgi:small subunit ribosomal protein S6e
MASFKVVIGTKDGKCLQKEIVDPQSEALLSKKIGDTVEGNTIGFDGYSFQITGGSDHCGFPMRRELPGAGRKRIFATKGVGLKASANGIRVRKTVCGNTIHEKTAQINLKVTKEGSKPLIEPPAEEPKAEEKPAEKKEVKPEAKKEEKPPAAKEEKPVPAQ